MFIPIVLLSALGFAAPADPGAAAGPASEPDAVTALLHARHFDEGCAPLLAQADRERLRASLVAAAEASSPPWAPLRAVGCLTELAATDDLALARVQDFIRDPATPGFVLPIVARLDVLPEPRALELAQVALSRAAAEPALRAAVPSRLRASTHAAVRAAVAATAPVRTIE